jgi:hypothetical protein
LRNHCYYHGDRHEPPRPPLTGHTAHTARAAHVDDAYVLEPNRLRVLTNRPGGWQPVAEPARTDRPDWDAIDQHAQPAPRLVATARLLPAPWPRITVDMAMGGVLLPLRAPISPPSYCAGA